MIKKTTGKDVEIFIRMVGEKIISKKNNHDKNKLVSRKERS
jgi:predicted peroxiredoxin